LKRHEYSILPCDEFVIVDLRNPMVYKNILDRPFDEVYQLAADMGGVEYIFTGEHDANVMHNLVMINLNILNYVRTANIKKYSILLLHAYIQNTIKEK
jgi:GDP-D-mannose 3', 5'-epimerase